MNGCEREVQPVAQEPLEEASNAAPSFEEALARLEQAVLRLESGELTLDEALAAYEEGVRMARLCASRLQQAEARLAVLTEQEGRLILQPQEGPGPGVNG